MSAPTSTAGNWTALQPARSKSLNDARLQLHYAAQFAAAMGISYLTPREDHSHTNLAWDPFHEALFSREVRAPSHAVRVAIRPRDITLIVLVDGSVRQRLPLHGNTISQVEAGLRTAVASAGLDGQRLNLSYDLPAHPVSDGLAFDVTRTDDFAELASWFGNASKILGELRSRIGSSEVRCWPHHFDIATLATVDPERSSGAGMMPGDQMYPEPYFYVNAYPALGAELLTAQPLAGGGMWNVEGWTGAVLTGSQLEDDASDQVTQVRAFLDSAIDTCMRLLRN